MLELPDRQACMNLTREEALGKLYWLQFRKYHRTKTFRPLWVFVPSPDITLEVWKAAYGEFPNIKTSKGVSSKEEICNRLAHYLRFFDGPKPSVSNDAEDDKDAAIAAKDAEIRRLTLALAQAQLWRRPATRSEPPLVGASVGIGSSSPAVEVVGAAHIC
jgi:hypothetical protein